MDAVAVHSGDYVELFKTFGPERIDRLVSQMRVGPTDRVADYGCGLGGLLHALPTFGSYDGVDFSPDFIREAERLSPDRGRFHCRDIVSFCADHPAEYDVAATLDFSEHIDDATFVSIYSAIRSSLKPSGRLYLHTPNRSFFMERLKERGIVEQLRGHIAVRTADENESLLKQCGFNSVRIERIAHYNVLRHIHPLSRISDLFAARLWIEAS